MRKLILLIFTTITVFAVGCNKKTKSSNTETYSNFLIGETVESIHQILGNPTRGLSGFWGDIYELENGSIISIYYDQSGKAEILKVTIEDGTETLRIVQE